MMMVIIYDTDNEDDGTGGSAIIIFESWWVTCNHANTFLKEIRNESILEGELRLIYNQKNGQ